LPPEPATLLSEGRVHEAVKVLRESHNLGSREARAWVDSHISDDPMLRVQLETQRRTRRRRIFLWLLPSTSSLQLASSTTCSICHAD
jgi:macrodomain Ter protein organizer (MatP/YcbG family)